ncbi:alpha/beta hydrolase [Nocardioides ochotonae]|uniref:alpha/beta hydrolase n=1 Tax=Nocardioides ochotonae TaxID=2685869 RepID=UPI001CD2BCED|nr:alpha/beta hydrolase [Nocardioides ochotonae]
MTQLDPRLDPEIAALLAFMESTGTPPMHTGTPAQARAAFRTLTVDMRDASLLPEVAEVSETTVPGGDGERPARLYRPRPRSEGPLPTVVLFHGGGWVIGDLDTHDLMARTLATACDAVVLSVDYRLAPEHPFPAAVEDAVAAARWAAAHLGDLGGDERLGLAGDSAGGNLAAVAAQALRDDAVPVAAQLLLYPATDLVGETASRTENAEGYFLDRDTMLWFAQQYVGALPPDRLTDPRLSPLHGELGGLAPAVVAVAQFDPLRDEGTAYAEALRAAGVPVRLASYDGLIHGFVDMGRFSAAARTAVEETCAAFRDLLHP